MSEMVNHPEHYQFGVRGVDGGSSFEVYKVISVWGLGFMLGNAVKYIARAGRKEIVSKIEDLKKAKWYIEKEIERLENGD